MIKFDNEKIMLLHEMVIEQTGGSLEVRDKALLDSAVNSIYQTFDGVDLYPSIEEKGARLCFALILNHAFVDGNKRVGILAMLSFFKMNDVHLRYTDAEIVKIGYALAEDKLKYKELLNWVCAHKVEKDYCR